MNFASDQYKDEWNDQFESWNYHHHQTDWFIQLEFNEAEGEKIKTSIIEEWNWCYWTICIWPMSMAQHMVTTVHENKAVNIGWITFETSLTNLTGKKWNFHPRIKGKSHILKVSSNFRRYYGLNCFTRQWNWIESCKTVEISDWFSFVSAASFIELMSFLISSINAITIKYQPTSRDITNAPNINIDAIAMYCKVKAIK